MKNIWVSRTHKENKASAIRRGFIEDESAKARRSLCESSANLPVEGSTTDPSCLAAGTPDSAAHPSRMRSFLQRWVQRGTAASGAEAGANSGYSQAGSPTSLHFTSVNTPDNLEAMTISQLRDVISQEKLLVDRLAGLVRRNTSSQTFARCLLS